MTTHSGLEGTVKVGSGAGTIVGELKEWNYSETADTWDDTSQADTDKTFVPGRKSWTGDAKAHFDPSDDAQGQMTVGSVVTVSFYNIGSSAGTKYRTGTAIITEVSVSHPMDDIQEASFSFQGSGALANSTVAGG